MVIETNRYAQQKIRTENPSNQSRLKQWKEVDADEMEKFVGIIIWMGLVKLPKLIDYWSKNLLSKIKS